MFKVLILASMVSVMTMSDALAHPHVWITMRSDVIFNEAREVTGIGVEWTFDDGYTGMALDGLDANGDGVYSQSELAPLTAENLTSLKEYNYFIAARVNGEIVPIKDAVESGQIYRDGKLSLHFQVPLAAPVDPRKSQFLFKIYDPEFFLAMDYVADDPVGIVGTMPEDCRLKVEPVISDQQLLATQEMLSSKGTEWKPENNEDFGGMFAQPAKLLCENG